MTNGLIAALRRLESEQCKHGEDEFDGGYSAAIEDAVKLIESAAEPSLTQDVKRYFPAEPDGLWMREDPLGAYVTWDDYVKLQHAYNVELLANRPKGDIVRSAAEPEKKS